MELWDIYDKYRQKTTRSHERGNPMKEGDYHLVVHVWIINSENEVLLQKRSPLVDNHPNEWDISAAGHVSAGEDYITSALRETEEEIGLKIEPKELIQIGELKQMSKREGYINNEVNPVYIVKRDLEVEKIKKQYEEVAEVKFMLYRELQNLIEKKDASFVQRPEEYKLFFKYLSE